jgi:Xaa-Pro aminopeptidase
MARTQALGNLIPPVQGRVVTQVATTTIERIRRLQAELQEPLLVTGERNLTYLTGFESSNAAALVESDRVRLFADARYTEAGKAVQHVEFVETGRNLLADLAQRLQGRIAVEEEHLSYAGFRTLASGGIDLIPTRGAVEKLRAVKDAEELAIISRASAIADSALKAVAEGAWSGHTEADLAKRLKILVLELGGDGVAFDVIVGSGPNGARPHSRPGDRVIQEGDLVIVDFGCVVDGYRSDCARTLEVGTLTPQLSEIVEVCLHALEVSLSTIGPGMTGVEADRVARRIIEDAGYGDNFGHALGHGIGLDVHEAPTVSKISTDSLAEGQVVTIEPGIYLPEVGGVRIENLCVVSADGLDSVTSLPTRIRVG